MGLLPKPLSQAGSQLAAAAQNAVEVARFGGLDTDEEASPYEVVAQERVYRLRRYRLDRRRRPTPTLRRSCSCRR